MNASESFFVNSCDMWAGRKGGSDVIMENLDRLWSVRSGKTIVTETSKHGLRIFSNNLMELFDMGW